MLMNVLIIGIWSGTIMVVSVGLLVKEKIEERKRMKAREKLWLL